MIESLVVGVDDSTGARSALHWAEQLVTAEYAEGRTPAAAMVTAWSRPTVDIDVILDDRPFKAAAADVLEDLTETLANPDRFETVSRNGGAAQVVLAEADDRDAGLIVVGTRGRGPIAQVLLGSVSRFVAAHSTRPVAVIPEGDHPATGPTVIGYDGSPGADAALRWTLENTEDDIIALSAWQLPSSAVYAPSAFDPADFERSADAMLTRGVSAVCGGSIDPRIKTIVQRADPRLAILDASLSPARIAMGARNHKGVTGLLLGSTVTYVTTNSPVPVIVVPPAD